MKIDLTVSSFNKITSDLLLIFVTDKWQEEVKFLGNNLLDNLSLVSKIENFSGKANQSLSIDTVDSSLKKIILFGIDNKKITNSYQLKNSIGQAIKQIKATRRQKIVISPHKDWYTIFPAMDLSQSLTEAVILSTYTFDRYKEKKHHEEKRPLEQVLFLTTPSKVTDFAKGIALGKLFAEATCFSRDLVNEPALVTHPTHLAKIAFELGKQKGIKTTIYEKDEIEKLGMGAFLGVSQGSDHPPKFIKLAYKPDKQTNKKVVLIGKGITFDTGGLSLKPSQAMETMKVDMSGAAAVLGVFSVITKLAPDAEVVGLIAACENMPSGKALRPGDIVTALNGKTIEVLNTDAEGRLTLADVLSYAVKYENPSEIIDLATLTGAMMVALGQDVTGFFGNNDQLVKKIDETAKIAGEQIWQLPLVDDYRELIKSNIADLKNVGGGRYGGAITAALFLEEFVEKVPWVHLDIAGPAYAEKDLAISPKGGTGWGVRLLLHLLINN